jgi:hypothetical protein
MNKRKRFNEYLKVKKTAPMQENDIRQSADNKIDEDFPGYPDPPSKKEMIKPVTKTEKKVAALNKKDGEKRTKEENINEQDSDGSGSAFDRTEQVND